MPSNLGANAPRDSGETDGAAKKNRGKESLPPLDFIIGCRVDPPMADRSGRHSAVSAGSAHYLGSYFFFLALAFGAAFFFLAGFLAFFLAGMDDSPLSFRSSGVREEKRFAHSCAQ
jgi:hypothetical protein